MFYDLLGQSDSAALIVLRHDAESDTSEKPHWSGVLLLTALHVQYIFGVDVHAGKVSKQDKDGIHLYTWMEHKNKKVI